MRYAEPLSLFNPLFVGFFNSKWVEYCCRHQRFYSNLCTCSNTSSFKSEYFLMRFWQSPFSLAFLIALKWCYTQDFPTKILNTTMLCERSCRKTDARLEDFLRVASFWSWLKNSKRVGSVKLHWKPSMGPCYSASTVLARHWCFKNRRCEWSRARSA